MAVVNKPLGQDPTVSSVLRSDYVMVSVGGSVRRIKIEDFQSAINTNDEQTLRQIAWGVPLKQSLQTSPAWGLVGNLEMWHEYKRQTGRYLVTNAGVAAKLNPANSAFYADGTSVTETKGHIMVIGPKLYYKVQEDSYMNCPVLWMSQLPIGGHYFANAAGEYNCYGAYKGTMSGSNLVSRSGASPTGNKSISSFWSAAQTNGSNWGLVDYDGRRWMAMLCMCETEGNMNIQASLGYGVAGSANKDLWATAATLKTGATKALGDATSSIAISVTNGANVGTDCSRVNILGLEDIYGWQWEMTQGIYFGITANSSQSADTAYIYKGNRMPTAAELAATPSGEFRTQKRYIHATNAGTEGYVGEMQLGEYFDILAKSLSGGGSTSKWCDYFWSNKETGQLCLFGGYAYDGSICGPFCVTSYPAFSISYASSGSRLAFYGPLSFTDGSKIA